ncbi:MULTISPECIES: DUF2383 domain-containing protein [Bacillaceae]|uniref:PA2169 family four-helix-bundle protein n=1 Tax=Evansella alkalicola TaxID=745819 RepID=A0ABS6JNM2_9BACI|nr:MULTISPECIES: DUF2383 domain-containing protein [Bacillaceae]MBU9720025.1 PA2169 family four-helix-bundle protein [Bacillus alkalicola]
MKRNSIVVEELNTLLRGTYMGIRSLEHYIQHTESDDLKTMFQELQMETKENAQKLAKRIQDLGGIPADSEGFSGRFHSMIHNAMLSNDSNKMLVDAVKGIEDYGVQYSEEVVKGDLDATSLQLVEEVIDTNRKQGEMLKNYLH